MILIDSHCHINLPPLCDNREAVLAKMQENAVAYALAVSVSQETFTEVLALSCEYPFIFASVGVHPAEENAVDWTTQELIQHAKHPRVVAIGETGLDYYWCQGDLTWQKQRFITHIEASNAADLPLIIHDRDAHADCAELLREYQARPGVFHCFTGDKAFARSVLDLGFYLSFSGVVTYKNAPDIQEACRYAPADRILVETDAPYLAPVPYRGKTNQPAYVRHTAEFVATLRQTSLEEIAAQTTENFFRLFNKAQPMFEHTT